MDVTPLISKEAIQAQIQKYGKRLQEDYAGKEFVLVMIMKGALCFVADLIRSAELSCTVEWISCSSYGENGTVAGELVVRGLDQLDLQGKDVLIVDDIFDTGKTLSEVYQRIQLQGPKSVATMVLLQREGEPQVSLKPDYALFQIERGLFVVGYGLDYKEKLRGLPSIGVLSPPQR